MSEYYYHLIEPKIISVQLDPAEFNKERMVQCILSQKDLDITNYHGGYTFEVMDPYHDFGKLYSKFLSIASDIFGPFNHSTLQKHWCWANVYNCDSFVTNMHNHETTCTINGVFYLNIPKDCESTEGGIKFLINGEEELYLPDELELIIMPNCQEHSPQYHSSTDYRIAINMEISTIEDVDKIYLLEKIYKKCKPQKN